MITGAIFIAMVLCGAVAGILKGLKGRNKGLIYTGVFVAVVAIAGIFALVFGN